MAISVYNLSATQFKFQIITEKEITMKASEADIPLERDLFLRSLLRELSGVLQDIVGIEQASGYISVVGQNMGDWLNREYRQAMNSPTLDREQVTDVLNDLKARIHGTFYTISQNEEKLVFGNTCCPFEDKVIGRPSLCMMTSNVFGTIVAENLGYAKVCLHQTIANGDGKCSVTVYLNPDSPETMADQGNEYFRSE